MKLSAIAAMAKNRVIGVNNTLPWRLPEDLKYFKQVTMGKPVIMGRKTFDSIGKPLPGRLNLVITRQEGLKIPGVTVVRSLDEALAACPAETPEAVVIGGAEIYRQSLSRLDRLYLTQIEKDFVGDAYFPEWREGEFAETQKQTFTSETAGLSYSFLVLDRSHPNQ